MADEKDNKTPDAEATENTETNDAASNDTASEETASEPKAVDAEAKAEAKPAADDATDDEANAESPEPTAKPKAKPKAKAKPAAKSKAKADTETDSDDDDADDKPAAAKAKKTSRRRGSAAKQAPAKKPAPKKPAEPILDADGNPILVKATAKYVRTSARKARLVLDNIRGQSVPEARVTLAFTERRAAKDVAKVLESAIANAEHNHELDSDDLHVAVAFADEGPTFKRWQPRARGRATPIMKRTAHITVVVSPTPAHQLDKIRKAVA